MNLNKILAEDDGSMKSYLLANITLPTLDIIDLFDKPGNFKLLMLGRESKNSENNTEWICIITNQKIKSKNK